MVSSIVCVYVCVCVRVCACMHVCVHACVCVSVCVWGGGGVGMESASNTPFCTLSSQYSFVIYIKFGCMTSAGSFCVYGVGSL